MNRRNILKSVPLIVGGGSLVKSLDACQSCEQGYIQYSCEELLKTINNHHKNGKKVHLLLSHFDIKTNRRHIPTFDLTISDFNVDKKILDKSDCIEYQSNCNEFRLFKLNNEIDQKLLSIQNLLDVWKEVSANPVITTHKFKS